LPNVKFAKKNEKKKEHIYKMTLLHHSPKHTKL
jgi:hypothetical protein